MAPKISEEKEFEYIVKNEMEYIYYCIPSRNIEELTEFWYATKKYQNYSWFGGGTAQRH